MNIKIKISCSDTSLPNGDTNPMINKFLPNWSNLWKNCQFYWNDDAIQEADYWIIIGNINNDQESCLCPPENVIFMALEPPSITRYDRIADFINQFYRVYLSHENVKHLRAYKCKPALNWWVDAGHPIKTGEEFNNWRGSGLGYDDFKKIQKYNKTKLISVFCSDKIFSPGHKARYNFCKKAKEHFKDRLDWFGSGINEIESKWDGIAPYQYHITIENSRFPDYWTEKLADCYMAGTYPIYSGAPNINEYFDQGSLTTIDIRYPKLSLAIIEKLIAENTYEKSQKKILQARDLVMDKYNLFNTIAEIVIKDNGKYCHKQLVKLKNWDHYAAINPQIFITKKRSFIAKISRSIAKKFNKLKLWIVDNLLLIKFKLQF